MNAPGYYRFPTIHGDHVVFTSEDDLWIVPRTGGTARRLTSGEGMLGYPRLSPDGSRIAFSGREEGHQEVYVMPAEGGSPQRVTYIGAPTIVVGWTPEGTIAFGSSYRQPLSRLFALFAVDPDGREPEALPHGPATHISYGPNGGRVIGRYGMVTREPAHWKRYRGGTAGDLWIDRDGLGEFERLIQIDGNLAFPLWVGERIYFTSDHEGIANLYSCTPSGDDLTRHTHHDDYYVRHPDADGERIVYHAGADLFVYDPQSETSERIEITYPSPRTQRNRKFVEAKTYLENVTLHPKGHKLAINARGKAFSMGNWRGPVTQYGASDGVRYRLTQWLPDGERLVMLSDAEGEEAIEIHPEGGLEEPSRLVNLDIGRPSAVVPSPTENKLALANHRNELVLVDIDAHEASVLDRSEHGTIAGFDWSPDGRWIAYGFPETEHKTSIRVCDLSTGETHRVTTPVLRDVGPRFDPDGQYLYFRSFREFDPVYDELHFELGFPRGARPYLVTLRSEVKNPFLPEPKAENDKPKLNSEDQPNAEDKADAGPKPVEIELDGIENRVLAFPISPGRYPQLEALSGKVLYTSLPVEGSLNRQIFNSGEPPAKATLHMFDLKTQQTETLLQSITAFQLSGDRQQMLYRAGNKLRVVKAGQKPDENAAKEPPGEKSGWVDLSRIKVSVTPPLEWAQMYAEAWRLQRDHFWNEEMSKVDWERIYERYRPLLDRVSTRGEFSDLTWEMQGELGTSHAYEIGGDYRPDPQYPLGFLGADLDFDDASEHWRISRIMRGDPWDENAGSPLVGSGVNAREGETLLAINGRPLSGETSPGELLVNQAGAEVSITLGDENGQSPRTVSVKTLKTEASARYRDWVEANRSRIHTETDGRVGYVHIPDMGPTGFAEFHRSFLSEVERDGLIVDVRFNGGGHVSGLLLEKLARRRLAFVKSRWYGAEPWPDSSPAGPMVALTNEWAGSDGDIFSHGFKLLNLGPLIGKRTWGGVVGINPRQFLVDRSITTQPEFSFWFVDIGWDVENRGTDPDIEVEIRPQDYAADADPQLDRALQEIERILAESPPLKPDLSERPSRELPELPTD